MAILFASLKSSPISKKRTSVLCPVCFRSSLSRIYQEIRLQKFVFYLNLRRTEKLDNKRVVILSNTSPTMRMAVICFYNGF
jgi:hypothetical protein